MSDDEKSDVARQYRAEMDIQRELDSFTSKGWFVQISVQPGGFVDVTAVGPMGVVHQTDQLANDNLEDAFLELEGKIVRARVVAAATRETSSDE